MINSSLALEQAPSVKSITSMCVIEKASVHCVGPKVRLGDGSDEQIEGGYFAFWFLQVNFSPVDNDGLTERARD